MPGLHSRGVHRALVIFVLMGGQWPAVLTSCGATGLSGVLTITQDGEECRGVVWCQETHGVGLEAFSKPGCAISSS